MRKRLMLCAGLAICVGCAQFQALFLGINLLVAIGNAPAGQKACAAFEVLNTQADGDSLSRLINAGLSQSGSATQFTPEQGDTLLKALKLINCEFISCYAAQVNALGPPSEDAGLLMWVQDRLELLGSVASACPSPTTLTTEQKLQLVRMVVALKL